MRKLAGKVAVVTGSSRSIGRGIACRLAADGALVGVHYSSNSQAAAEVVDTIEHAGGQAFSFGAELGVEGDAELFWTEFDEQRAKYSGPDETGLDIIVNNVGIALRDHFEEASSDDFDRMFAVNVKAPFFIVQQGLDRLHRGARVINISSIVTRLALTDVILYATTKGALDTFTLILAKALGDRGITVNSVAPGFIDTDSNAGWLRVDEQAWSNTAAQAALGRVGEPEDVADVVAFLATDEARWITGQVIDVSGGTRL